jgi:methylthioribose-1-phosphate isomerase
VKFLVAAPRTSIDLQKQSGEEIKIEHRPDNELTLVRGPIFADGSVTGQMASVSMAPQGMNVWNPAFDVTPAELIDAIITESRVVEKEAGSNVFQLREAFPS